MQWFGALTTVIGGGMPAFLRSLISQSNTFCARALDHAAELLRDGKHNVTESVAAMGYNSLSHSTVAFRESFGRCRGLFSKTCVGSCRTSEERR